MRYGDEVISAGRSPLFEVKCVLGVTLTLGVGRYVRMHLVDCSILDKKIFF